MNLSPKSVSVFGRDIIKLSNFSDAKFSGSKIIKSYWLEKNTGFFPPEWQVSSKLDVWAAGCVFFELINKLLPRSFLINYLARLVWKVYQKSKLDLQKKKFFLHPYISTNYRRKEKTGSNFFIQKLLVSKTMSIFAIDLLIDLTRP